MNFGSVGCLGRCLALWSIIVEHVRENVLGVLEALGHLRIVTVEGLAQRHDRPFALLIHISHQAVV